MWINDILKEAKWIGKEAAEDWLEKVVEHTTPGGQKRKVKVKSLPSEERAKYKPSGKDESLKKKIEEKKKSLEKPSKERRKELDKSIDDVFNAMSNSGSAASLSNAIKKHNLSDSEAKWFAEESMHDIRLDLKDQPDKLKKMEDEVKSILSGKKPTTPKKEKTKKLESNESNAKSLTKNILKGYPESSDINFRDDFEGKVKHMLEEHEGRPPMSKRELKLKMEDIANDLARTSY